MTKKDFEKLGTSMLPELPGFAVKGELLFVQPIGHTLRGIWFDGSSFEPRLFFAQVFVQPMFVPAQTVTLNLGWRIGGGSLRWDIDAPDSRSRLIAALKSEALPFLMRIRSPQDLPEAVTCLDKSADPYVRQAIAYAWARAGVLVRATEELERLVRLLDINVAWQRDMVERAENLASKLLDNPREAQRWLADWEDQTMKNLRLEKYR